MPLRIAFVLLACLSAKLLAQTHEFTTIHTFEANQTITALAADEAGNLYFADSNRDFIGRIAANGAVSVIAGQPGSHGYQDGTATAARFNSPEGLALDRHGNLFVADTANHRIRKIDPDGNVTTIAGTGIASLANGPTLEAQFSLPVGITVDAQGNLFVADGNNRIRRIAAGGNVTTLAGQFHFEGPTRRDGAGNQALFRNPHGLVLDRDQNLVVADDRQFLRKIDTAAFVTTIAGGGSLSDDVGIAVRLATAHIARDAQGTIYFADANFKTLRAYRPDGSVVTLAGQTEQSGTANGLGGLARFTDPRAIASTAAGHLYLVDGRSLRRGLPVERPAPPIITTPPAYTGGDVRSAGANTRVTFRAGATGAQPLTYQWRHNGVALSGAVSDTLEFPAVTGRDSGQYTVVVTNGAGAVQSLPITLNVFTPSLASFTPRRSTPGGSFLWAIASGPTQLVAVGTGGTILTSTDGRAWTRRNSGTAGWLVGATYAEGKFIVVGAEGTILTSTDGTAWRRVRDSGTTQRLNNVIHAVNRFVAVGERGTIVTSTDGETWTPRSSGVETWLRGLVYQPYKPLQQGVPPKTGANIFTHTTGSNGSQAFYASGQGGIMLTSTDGLTWSRTGGPKNDIEALATGVGGVGQDGTILIQGSILASAGVLAGKTPSFPGGLTSVTYPFIVFPTWSQSEIGIAARFRGLARAAGAIFAMGENGALAAAPDYAGPWAQLPTGTTANLVGAALYGDTLYIVGENETILASSPLHPSRLANLSTRGRIVGETSPLLAGFVVGGTDRKPVLLRAAGPGLTGFGVTDALARPRLTLRDGSGRAIEVNTGWSTPNGEALRLAALQVGAFPFAAGSADAAMLATLDPGNYTMEVTGVDGAAGVALIEAYDTSPVSDMATRLINVSTRGNVSADSGTLVAGFVVTGSASRSILIRAVGSSLGAFGVPGVLTAPRLELLNSHTLRAVGEPWSTVRDPDSLRAVTAAAGAFRLDETDGDAVLYVTLPPGTYTAAVTSRDGTSGAALVEIYEVP